MTDTNNTSVNNDKQIYADMLFSLLDNMHNIIKILMRITIPLITLIILTNGVQLEKDTTISQLAINIIKSNKSKDYFLPYLILFVFPIIYKIITQIPILAKNYVKLIIAGDLKFANELINILNRYSSIIKYFIVANLTVIVGATIHLLEEDTITASLLTGTSCILFYFIFFSKKLNNNEELNLVMHLAKKIIKNNGNV